LSTEEIREIRERVARLETRQEDLLIHVDKNTQAINDLHQDLEELREKISGFLDWKKIVSMVVAIIAAVCGVGVAT